jgi:hypothetical protein
VTTVGDWFAPLFWEPGGYGEPGAFELLPARRGPHTASDLLLAPNNRDSHLIAITHAVLPLLRYQRLTADELLTEGLIQRRGHFQHIDEDLLWRGLMHAERRRWATQVPAPSRVPRDSQWDLTEEGLTQVSLLGLLGKRAKLAGILGLIGLGTGLAEPLGVDLRTAIWIALVPLALFASMFTLYWWGLQMTHRPALRAARKREDEVQLACVERGIKPWWPNPDLVVPERLGEPS